MEYRFARPLDVLYLRGNRLFGGPGEHAEAQMPPWPSLAAGALRSRMLVDHQVDLARFAEDEPPNDAGLAQVLGTPQRPGTFRIGMLAVAREKDGAVEAVFPPPADLFVPADDGPSAAQLLEPVECSALAPVSFSHSLPAIPVLRAPKPEKATSEFWLRERGLAAYLAGTVPSCDDFIPRGKLWTSDPRLGIALNSTTRSADTGRLYTTDTVAFHENAGFLIGVAGAEGVLPADGLLRLGGDGRGASLSVPKVQEVWRRLPQSPRFRMVLSTPGLFPSGWLPLPLSGDAPPVLRIDGLEARLVAAAVPRAQVVSGWDLARREPKPAQRVVPAGAVYWFETVRGDMRALERVLDEGLWSVLEATGQLAVLDDRLRTLYAQRRAEGFNNVWLGDWGSAGHGRL